MMTMIAPRRCRFFKFPMLGKNLLSIKAAVLAMLLCGAWTTGAMAQEKLGSEVKQLIVSIAPDWNTNHGSLQLFERRAGQWIPVMAPWPVLYGKNGLVWGRGILGSSEPGPHKVEKDGRAPAGVFRIGTIYTYDSALPA